MTILEQMLLNTDSAVILGHVRPDGDCLGSALGLYNYIRSFRPDIRTAVYLEEASPKFAYLKGFEEIRHRTDDESYRLCICVDSSDRERLGEFAVCEVLFGQMDEKYIDKSVAECLYTGIVHDTGVFKFSCTSPKTMEIAGRLMGKGVDFGNIIDDSFYRKTYIQNQILGRALLESITFLDGRCIFSAIRQNEMKFYGVDGKDMDGIIDQLRLTEGVEVAIFMYQTGASEYKVSLRSQNIVDVSRVASFFGGGGHVRAAGCTMSGSIHDVINNLSLHIEKQLNEREQED